jgi:large exoprotein involved in heme utilization and adhesion
LTIDAESIRVIGTSADGLPSSSLTTGTLGELRIKTDSLLVSDGAFITTTFGDGKAGNLLVDADSWVRVIGNSRLDTGTIGDADGGNLSIKTDSLLVSDGASISTSSSFLEEDEGDTGNLTINTRNLLVRDGAQVSTETFGGGAGGDLIVIATDSVQVIGTSADGRESGLLARTTNSGEAGNISIETGNLIVRDGALISASTFGEGEGGNLTINANDSVQVFGTSANGELASRLFSRTTNSGEAGNISIETGNLIVRDGAQVGSDTFGEGAGGNITVIATDSVQVFGTSANDEINSSLSSQTENRGDAGNLRIETGNLIVRDGSQISAGTLGEGVGGDLIVIATDSVRLIGESADGFPSGLFTSTGNRGEAGNLRIDTGNLIVSDGAAVNSNSFGEGEGGNAGNINIETRSLSLTNNAGIAVNSKGTKPGGNIDIQADSAILEEGIISAETASTDGGNLTLDIQDLLLLRNGSQISTTAGTAEAGGDGGIIEINAGSIAAIPLENSEITANAFLGNGGRVIINTQSIFGIDFRSRLTPLSDITASSERGAAGEVIINTSGIEPTRGLENLTEERINVEVAQGCQVGASKGGRISFYNVGRGGLPPSPDDLFNSPPTQEWLSLESEENRSSQPKTEPSFSQQSNNTVASQLIFSCQVR